MAILPHKQPPASDDPLSVPLGGTRAQALQRLQVGLSLLIGIILIVGLANVIEQRAKQSDASAVPQAAATTEPTESATAAVDPLADAGVVPDMPASEPTAQTPAGAGNAPAGAQ